MICSHISLVPVKPLIIILIRSTAVPSIISYVLPAAVGEIINFVRPNIDRTFFNSSDPHPAPAQLNAKEIIFGLLIHC